jgi:hypothetical protein
VALSFKFQAIIFLPLVFLLLLSKTLGVYKISDYMKLLGVCILTVFLIIFPFLSFYERMALAMTNSVDIDFQKLIFQNPSKIVTKRL